jgi:IMP dehydrogenase/GMP reductase
MKLDWNDISIVPAILSDIDSRSEITPFTKDGKLPLFTAPMDTVIDEGNIDVFEDNGFNICLPRNIKYSNLKNDNYFYSYGLDEIISIFNNNEELPKKVLIDVANGHMRKLFNISKSIKEKYGDEIELMVGNIANPSTYREYCNIGVDYIRVGIGGGSACTTSANVGIHYPMASLVSECALIADAYDNPTKIIADGGFKNFADIIKALALGADYVMLGGVLNKSIESCGKTYLKDVEGQFFEVDLDRAANALKAGVDVYKYYRGMSTKEVQRSWNRAELKTGEGITKYNKVEHTISGWCENFTDYLKSQMSYVGSVNLEGYIGNVEFINISQNAFMRFNK